MGSYAEYEKRVEMALAKKKRGRPPKRKEGEIYYLQNGCVVCGANGPICCGTDSFKDNETWCRKHCPEHAEKNGFKEKKEPLKLRHKSDPTPRTVEVIEVIMDMISCMSPGSADNFAKELARGVAIGMVNGVSYDKPTTYDHIERLFKLSRG